MRRVVETERAPAAVGPYSQAIAAAGTVWVSGQIGLDPRTGKLVEGGTEAEARQALANLRSILEAAGSSIEGVVQATLYLTDLTDFEKVNGVWAETFVEWRPARVCVEVSRLPKGARVEVAAVAAT